MTAHDVNLIRAEERAEISICARIPRPSNQETVEGYKWLSSNSLPDSSRRYVVSCRPKVMVQGTYNYVGDGASSESGVVTENGTQICKLVYGKASRNELRFPDVANQNVQIVTVEARGALEAMSDPLNNECTFLLESQSNAVTHTDHKEIISNSNSYLYDKSREAQEAFALHPAVGQFLIDQSASDNNTRGLDCFADIVGTATALQLGLHVRNGTLVLPISIEHGDRWDRYVDGEFARLLHNMRTISLSDVPISGVNKANRDFIATGNKVNVHFAPAKVAFGIDEAIPADLPMTNPPRRTLASLNTAIFYGTFKRALETRQWAQLLDPSGSLRPHWAGSTD